VKRLRDFASVLEHDGQLFRAGDVGWAADRIEALEAELSEAIESEAHLAATCATQTERLIAALKEDSMSDAFVVWKVANGWACMKCRPPTVFDDKQSAVSFYPSFGGCVEWLEWQGRPPLKPLEGADLVEVAGMCERSDE
jgi:hypothetical protein